MRKPQSLDQRRALYQAAVINQDAAEVASLLRAGASPDDTYRGRSIFKSAWEAVAAPTVIAKLLKHCNGEVPKRWLWDALKDDRFGVEHVAAIFDLVAYTGNIFDRRWATFSLGPDGYHRTDACLAAKIRFMCSKGWKPAEAWVDGVLPFHNYLAKGRIEAAVACVEGGMDPREPIRVNELTLPTTLAYWPEFEARLIAKKRQEQGDEVVVSITRQRVRA